nr:MAG TPA: hypothetical protein [Caudoviricetes sp.]
MTLQEKMGRNHQRHYLYCKVVRGWKDFILTIPF